MWRSHDFISEQIYQCRSIRDGRRLIPSGCDNMTTPCNWPQYRKSCMILKRNVLTIRLALFSCTLSTFGTFCTHAWSSRWLMLSSYRLINSWCSIRLRRCWLLTTASTGRGQHGRPLCLQPLNDLQLLNVLSAEYMTAQGTTQCGLQVSTVFVSFGWTERSLVNEFYWRSVFWTLQT